MIYVCSIVYVVCILCNHKQAYFVVCNAVAVKTIEENRKLYNIVYNIRM